MIVKVTLPAPQNSGASSNWSLQDQIQVALKQVEEELVAFYESRTTNNQVLQADRGRLGLDGKALLEPVVGSVVGLIALYYSYDHFNLPNRQVAVPLVSWLSTAQLLSLLLSKLVQ